MIIDRWLFICCTLLAVAEGKRDYDAIAQDILDRSGIELGPTWRLHKWADIAEEARMLRKMSTDKKVYFVLTPKGRLALVKYKKTARLMVKVMQGISEDVERIAKEQVIK
jgi:hypothetical protein